MSAPLVIENARIVDPASDTDRRGAILIENGVFADMDFEGGAGVPDGAIRVDAKGHMLAPGLIDMRVFTGEPGHEYRETLASAAAAAAAGGVTGMLLMPDTRPVIDDAALVDFIIRRSSANGGARALPAAAMTRGLEGREITEFGLLKDAGAKCVTDGRSANAGSRVLRAAMTYAANFDLPVSLLALDPDLAGDGVMNEGAFSSGVGLRGIPAEAETIPLDRDIQLALMTGVRFHSSQISVGGSAAIVLRGKQSSDRISAGVSINSLSLNENDVGAYRTFFKLSPPLRSEDDRQAMIAALKAGVIDVINSDHDPQDVEVKRRPFAEAASGAIGLETLFAVALRLHHSGDVDLKVLLRAMTQRPAEILGLESGRIRKGASADFFIADLELPWVVDEASLRSRSANTCFEGATLQGRVLRTFVGGDEVYALDRSGLK